MSKALFLAFLISLSMVSAASAHEYRVGGPRGWVKPVEEETETYNDWAGRNRFHIGDSLYFKYTNDSVLLVDREGYVNCNTSNPQLAFTDGNSTFWFDRYVPGSGSSSDSYSGLGPSSAPWSSSAAALNVIAGSYRVMIGLGFGLVVLMFV
ncbi:mavicyanin-like [Asparagus officinalis]|uniref:mavicyanin-like n=1 Tax=Asparagus officinalis TaxID=4686 RepID=UPI00098DFC2F|nr:mavicyanin-like [Asparagus officinalis]